MTTVNFFFGIVSFHVNLHISFHFRPKKSNLVSENRSGEKLFITYSPAYVKCVREFFFVSKTHTHKQKIFPLANLFVRIYVFFPSKNKR